MASRVSDAFQAIFSWRNKPLKNYKFIKTIGKGSFGEVILCQHKDKQQYVVKKMDLSDPEVKKVADAERDKLSQLNHEHIVAYRECFVAQGFMWLIMEYCSGGDLAIEIEALQQKKTFFPEDQVQKWTFQICLGLQYLHSHNTIHRDLKPQNIFLTATKDVKIGDFGIARTLNPGDLAQTFAGTPIYLSPEIINQQPYDNKVDVWALGCCVYEMMTLHTAVDPVLILLMQKWVVGKMPTNYSPELVDLTDSMLSIDENQRPTVDQILASNIMTLQQQKKDAAQTRPDRRNSAVKELHNQGLVFNNNGQLVDVATGRLFEYQFSTDQSVNNKRYELIAQSVTKYVEAIIESDLKMDKIVIPINAKPNDAQSYIYGTRDWKTNAEKLLVLVQGAGSSRAGEWFRSVIVNDCIDAGSQIPWVKRAVADGYGVLLLSPNLNHQTIADKEVPVRGSESHQQHFAYVWENFIMKAQARDVFIVACSVGGRSVYQLATQKTQQFLSKVKSVAFVDSLHEVKKKHAKALTDFLHKRCKQWACNGADLETLLFFETWDAPCVSSGEIRSEWTPWSCFDVIFEFLASVKD